MITDHDCISACLDLYYNNAGGFEQVWTPESDDGVCVALKRADDIDLVVFRGSETAEDWARDFFAVPHETANYPQLGDVHAGFMLGMSDALSNLMPSLRDRIVVTGHSLGAARATLFCGLLIASERHPEARVVFGEPRSGCGDLTWLLSTIKVSRSYRNAGDGRHDYVTDVPTDPPFDRVTHLIDVYAPPAANDPWGLLAMHHPELYAKAVPAVEAA